MSHDHHDEVEPIPGLPHELPPGERILWQGRPRWTGLARHVFQVGWVAAYFGVLVIGRAGFALRDGKSVSGAISAALAVTPLALAGLGLLALLALMTARATVYTITSQRVVMRFGLALPITFNLPFRRLAAADVKVFEGGEGDIALGLAPPDKIAWLHLWPHARPGHLARPQPAMRAIPDAARVGTILANAVEAWAHTSKGGAAVAPGEVAEAA